PKAVSLFATGLAGAVDIKVSPDGSLYVLNRRMWVKDENFKAATGSLHKITYMDLANNRAPRITRQASDVTVIPGQSASLVVVATGDAPLSYQWLKNGKAIPNANTAKLTVTTVQASDNGTEYRCVVANKQGRTKSVRARVEVVQPSAAERPSRLTPGLAW